MKQEEWARAGVPVEVSVTDRYGDERIIHRSQGILKLKRARVTPVLALNQEIAALAGKRIRALRELRGYTLAGLCARAGIVSATPKSRMWEIENSVRQQGLRMGTLYALAMALDVGIYDLLPSVEEVRHIADVGPVDAVAVRDSVA